MCNSTCADPESFVTGGPNLTTSFFVLVDERIQSVKPELKGYTKCTFCALVG